MCPNFYYLLDKLTKLFLFSQKIGFCQQAIADNKLLIFLRKQDFDISCKLSPKETICIIYQSLFSEKNKENISICYQLKSLPSRVSVNIQGK